MKFSQMPYERPEYQAVYAKLTELLERFKAAKTADDCFAAQKEYSDLSRHVGTMFSIASVRNDINTADAFYAGEKAYMNETGPKLQTVHNAFTAAIMESPFRKDLEAKWGTLFFKNQEMRQKIFSPEIIPEMQEDNRIVTEYQKLTASAQIEFDGKTLNIAQLYPYSLSPDREMRKAATMARASWYAANADALDSLTDSVIKVRAAMAKKLGFTDYAQMGQTRMLRHFGSDMIKSFRDGVAQHIVPVAARLKEEQAKRIGVDKLELYDDSFEYPDGNAKPNGTAEDIIAHGRKMYHELSAETADFIDFLIDNELIEYKARPGKTPGGYCAMFNEYGTPFIYSTFNGTAGDVSVLTHEAGHAMAFYVARDIYPTQMQSTFGETAESHAMAMEFFTFPWLEGFFGDQADKYRRSKVSGAITSLTRGTMFDEFEHIIYAKPEMSPKERNELWLSLERKYMPWIDSTGIPFYGDGRGWQAILHFFTVPMYYISYMLAQTVALCFWGEDRKNHEEAWQKYRRFMGFAATKTFQDLISDAGLLSPFDGDTLKILAADATSWLDNH